MKPRSLFIPLALTAFLIAACGGGDSNADSVQLLPESRSAEVEESPTRDQTGDGASRQNTTVEVIDTVFMPEEIVVSAGARVTWKQVGDQPHSVTANDKTFDSNPDCSPLNSDKCMTFGDEFSFTFDEPGTYDYYCRVHGLPSGTGMVGTITVE